MRRLSCHRFRANAVLLGLSVTTYNLTNQRRRLTLPTGIGGWSRPASCVCQPPCVTQEGIQCENGNPGLDTRRVLICSNSDREQAT
jgi:hypothetical protein